MKQIVFVFAFLLTISFQLNAQWFWNNTPVMQGSKIEDVCFTDFNTGWIVGDVGSIMKTSDGGENWVKQLYGNFYHLSSVDFVNNNTGMGGWRRWYNSKNSYWRRYLVKPIKQHL